jgi:3-hydroxyisobutyrate dehydrogenase-like beta-hydroxyacid dehydrogenase
MQLGFIGTGTMGQPMARCLLQAGHQVTVHDLRRDATTALCEAGALWAGTPRAVAAASEVVCASPLTIFRGRFSVESLPLAAR